MKRFWVSTAFFLAMAWVIPLFYFMIADGALMPYGGIVMLLIFHLSEASVVAFLEVIHIVIYTPVLFLFALILGQKVCPPGTDRFRLGVFAVLIGVILSIGFLPILSAGHGVYEDLSAYRFYPKMYEDLLSWGRGLSPR